MITVDQIRDRLANYTVGEVSLEDFEDWFVSHSWNVHQNSNVGAQELVFEIEVCLAEYSGGHISESSLRSALAKLLQGYSTDVNIGIVAGPSVRTHTSSSQALTSPTVLRVSAEIRSVAVPA